MRSSRKILVDLFTVQTVTDRHKHYIDEQVRHSLEALSDSKRKDRREARECAWCFYFCRNRLAGQAFTDWECSGCNTPASHPNTSTPVLCDSCSDKLGLCVRCGADLDLKMRTTMERKARR